MSNFIFSNEQKRIVEYDKNAVIQVNGCPGSGKTLVAIKKSLFLANKYNKKVLFLYYNKSLGFEIRRLFGSSGNKEKNEMIVLSRLQFCDMLLREKDYGRDVEFDLPYTEIKYENTIENKMVVIKVYGRNCRVTLVASFTVSVPEIT